MAENRTFLLCVDMTWPGEQRASLLVKCGHSSVGRFCLLRLRVGQPTFAENLRPECLGGNKTMKRNSIVFATALVLSGLATPRCGVAQTNYTLTELGTFGGNNSIPFWITNTGDVIGFSETGKVDVFGNPIQHAFLWSKGMMQDLGTLGGNNSSATGAGDEGVAAGIADVTGGATSHAVIWYNGAITDLGTLSGLGGFSYAQFVNDQQQVVGGSTTSEGGFHAV